MTVTLPVINMKPLSEDSTRARKEVASKIASACSDIGFFAVIGHPVPADLITRTRAAACSFFNAPEEIKRAVLRPPEKLSRGWNPPADRSLALTRDTHAAPDLQEAFAMGPPHIGTGAYFEDGLGKKMFAPNQWPEIASFQETLLEYYDAMSEMARSMLRGFALALNLDELFFAPRTDRHCSVVRLVHYLTSDTSRPPGQLRAGAHTDYGTFTFVRGDNVPGGLQVKARDGGWHDVETPEGGFICNIGDAMEYWTGGRFRSTLHRVALPPADHNHAVTARERISLVYFHQPNHDAVLDGISPARETTSRRTITFGDHYLAKIRRAAAGVTSEPVNCRSIPPGS